MAAWHIVDYAAIVAVIRPIEHRVRDRFVTAECTPSPRLAGNADHGRPYGTITRGLVE